MIDYQTLMIQYMLHGLGVGAAFHVIVWLLGYGVRMLGKAFGSEDEK